MKDYPAKKAQKNSTHSLHLKVEDEQFNQILKWAEKENRTKANMGEVLLTEALNARKK